jgi:hypothetical protein
MLRPDWTRKEQIAAVSALSNQYSPHRTPQDPILSRGVVVGLMAPLQESTDARRRQMQLVPATSYF